MAPSWKAAHVPPKVRGVAVVLRAALSWVGAALPLPDNVIFLGARRTHLRDGVLFVGACGWWDFEFCAPEKEPADARAHFRRVACDELCAPCHNATWPYAG